MVTLMQYSNSLLSTTIRVVSDEKWTTRKGIRNRFEDSLHLCSLSYTRHTHGYVHTQLPRCTHSRWNLPHKLLLSHTLCKSVSKSPLRWQQTYEQQTQSVQAYQPFSSRWPAQAPIMIKCLILAHSITGQRAVGTSACVIHHLCYWLPCDKPVCVCIGRSGGDMHAAGGNEGLSWFWWTSIQLEGHKCVLA